MMGLIPNINDDIEYLRECVLIQKPNGSRAIGGGLNNRVCLYIDELRAKVAELQSSHDALEAKLAKYKNLEPAAWHHPDEGLSYENHYTGNIPLYVLEK